MCNLHIKETEISQKRSKGIKNWKITYSVILSARNAAIRPIPKLPTILNYLLFTVFPHYFPNC